MQWNSTDNSNTTNNEQEGYASSNRVLCRSASTAPSGNPATSASTITVYEFWFNGKDDHYILGEEDGSWQEIMQKDERDAEITRSLQKRLREASQ